MREGDEPPIRRVREPAGREREMFRRPVLPSGKANVRSLTSIVGEGIFPVVDSVDEVIVLVEGATLSRWTTGTGTPIYLLPREYRSLRN